MNPRAAINNLHPFQGCPFSHLGYFSTMPKNAFRLYILHSLIAFVNKSNTPLQIPLKIPRLIVFSNNT